MFRAGVIVASDKGSVGERKDKSGALILHHLKELGYEIVDYALIADEKELIKENLIRMADELKLDLIMTTGGTGFSKRDVTPEATLEVIDKEAPGIAEAIRYHSLSITPRAMLSRGVSGIRKDSLIINMPGSPKAVVEIMEYIMDSIPHGLEIMTGKAYDCAEGKQ